MTSTARSAYSERTLYTTVDSSITYHTDIEPPHGRQLSLADFYDQNAPVRNPGLTRVLMEFLERNEVRRAFAPRLRFTRAVVEASDMDICIMLPNGIPLWRTSEPRDATNLPEPGDACIGSYAGCAALAMVCGSEMVAGHGGRESLIDRDVVSKTPGHEDQGSIVDAMARAVSCGDPERLARASCRSFYNLARRGHRYAYDHPEHGDFNRALSAFLEEKHDAKMARILVEDESGFELDQGLLIGAQADVYGFHRVSTSISPLRSNSVYATTYHNNECRRGQRNLVAIVRER